MPSKAISVKDRVMNDEIDLGMSDLTDVPVKEIAQIKKATSLDVSNNNIKVLPKNFITLTHLTKLDLSRNNIIELPEEFGELFRLRHLDLYQNKLQYLPLSFNKLKMLKWLDLKNNPLKPAIADVAGPCLDTKDCQECAKNIVKFYTTIQERVYIESENREKQRKKQKEINLQKEKNEKKTKAKPNKKQDVNGQVKDTSSVIDKKISNKDKKVKVKKYEPRNKSSLLNILFMFFLLGLTLLFILTSVNYKHTVIVKQRSISLYQVAIEYLPNNCKDYGTSLGEYFSFVHEKTGNLTHNLVNCIITNKTAINLYNNIVQMLENIVQNITLFVNDFYKIE